MRFDYVSSSHYEYLVISMGLLNSLAIFQNYTSNMLRGYIDNFYIVYLDNILVFSKIQKDHNQHLKLITKRLRQAELFVNLQKSEFYKTEVEYLGYIINLEGVKLDPNQVDIIIKWKEHPPKTY
jgi:hypothetical protein